ncbi:hypothetical protein HNQ92_005651 [Rhabdobacter roseus]|uniref:Lasso RiPP family leader peptide-containing protein n=1 Tax=Rhabdobacter roseus TaxID=1655419 RepID=A0A840U162_9BACT|nr:hypothetical protein [Rhabdobacter roseus]MBB5287487.1 hypothetical protein [Rhabdobacter roseus]
MKAPSTKKAYKYPVLTRRGTLAKLTLKTGSLSDSFSPYSA